MDHTPFYAESGGQIGDKGILSASGHCFRVDDTQKIGQAVVHYGEVMAGTLAVNQVLLAQIDTPRREAIRLNHTATHLLHAALKNVVGSHVQQKGSLVDAERARFDFSHYEALTAEQIQKIERLVNEQIRANHPVATQVMAIDEAKESGAVALFGEKYGESVRVLSMGDFSRELCGGTHARRTGDIGLFKIVSEYGIASGVRRIEMVTGCYALDLMNEQQQLVIELAAMLKATPVTVRDKLTQLMQENKQLDKEINKLLSEKAQKSGADLLNEVEKVNGTSILIRRLDGMDMQTLRTTLDQLKSRLDSAVIVLFALDHDKINVVAGISKDRLGKNPSAVTLVKHLCGKGGGREDMAQGGGPAPEQLEEKIKEIKTMISE